MRGAKTSADGRRLTDARVDARSSFVVGRSSVAPIPSFRRPAEGFTTKAPRHQGKTHREVREVREEKTFSPQRRKGHEGKAKGQG
jgi:hypothetical protein